jgi:hypothetical protein
MPPQRGAQRPISGKSRFLKLQVTCRRQVAPLGRARAVKRRNLLTGIQDEHDGGVDGEDVWA